MESTDNVSTSSPNVKPKRNYFEQYLPLYQKTGEGESSESWKIKDRTSKKNDYKYSKPERNAGKWQKKQRQTIGFSQVIIDGASLSNSSPGNSSSVHALSDSKVTSTPVTSSKKSKNKGTSTKIQISQIESNETIQHDSFNLSRCKSNKRNKSVSFQLEENDEIVIKRPKSDISNDTETEDSPRKGKSQKKKKKKSSKENIEAVEDSNLGAPVDLKNQIKPIRPKESSVQSYADKETDQRKTPLNDKNNDKNVYKSDKAEDLSLSIPDSVTKQNEGIIKAKKLKNAKIFKKSASESDITEVPALKKKPKKQKHQDLPENADGEPPPKSPKQGIADNLESLSLGDNPHTLTNLINEMTVVDKTKKKKLKKEANREKTNKNIKTKSNENSVTIKRSKSEEIVNKKVTEEGPQIEGDTGAAGDTAPKKWDKKRWNKKQKMNNDKMTLNIDNLPVSLLKGNFKKMLIDHFSEYGLYRGVGEAYPVNEEVFSTRIHFDTAEAATKALKRDGSIIADNEIRVSEVLPKTETTIVVRIYGPPQKLAAKDLLTTFREFGIIRSIRLVPHRKKTMTTAFVEFDSQQAVDAALDRSVTVDLTVNSATIMVDKFQLRETNSEKEKKKKNKKKRKTKKNKSDSENVPATPIVEESAKDAPVEKSLDNDESDSDYSVSD